MSIPTGHPFDFDPTYGLWLDELRAMRPPEAPPDFDDFWRARYVGALGVNPQPQLRTSGSRHPNWRVHHIVYTSTDKFQIGGSLLLPREEMVSRGLVVGHGYGGRDQPDFDIPVKPDGGVLSLFSVILRSSRPPITADPALHVLYDIDKPESYILGGCVEDLWLAVSVLTQLYPEVDGRIGYIDSFGGGIGALGLLSTGASTAATSPCRPSATCRSG